MLLSKATYSNSYIHSYTDGGGCHAKCWPAHQEQFGVKYFAQGHFDMQISGISEPVISQLQDKGTTPFLLKTAAGNKVVNEVCGQ